MRPIPLCLMAAALFGSCQPAARHRQEVGSDEPGKSFTLGAVQKKIQVGMSQADVAAALGSPNIIAKDAKGKEAWVYDKVAREISYSKDEGGVWLLLGVYSKNAGAQRSSQRTLTVVIKFDTNNLVEDVAYHSSQF